MTDYGDPNLPGFSGGELDRCDDLRADPERLAACFRDPAACRVVLSGLDPVVEDNALLREAVPADAALDDHLLLGQGADGRPLFVELRDGLPHGQAYAPNVWKAAETLSPAELGLYGCARSLVDWHARHGFCAACGGATRPIRGGWSRRCGACAAEHFPRVDPVVIMLAEHDGRVLVGRQPRFPPRRYSALAGFVEPGETIEAAVARELFEEAGLRVTNVRYVMSQPWPFPSSLMIACTAQAEQDQLTLDRNELEDALWVDADGVRAAFEGRDDAPFIAPPSMAVAHHLLRHWLNGRS